MDKFLHFTVMMTISFLLCLLLYPIWAVVICLTLSIGKEVYDCIKPSPTGFDLLDLLSDVLGILAGMGISILVTL